MRRSEDTTGRNRRRRIALVFDELPEAHAGLGDRFDVYRAE